MSAKAMTALLLTASCVWPAMPVSAAVALDPVLENYARAVGAAKIGALTSQRIVKRVQFPGGEMVQIFLAKRPVRFRVESLLPHGRLIQGFDGTRAWSTWEPRRGEKVAVPLTPEASREFADAARFALADELTVAGADGAALALQVSAAEAGSPPVIIASGEGRERFRVELDPATNLPATKTARQENHALVVRFGRYRHQGGIAFPLETVLTVDGKEAQRITLCSVSIDEEMDDALFDDPNPHAGSELPTDNPSSPERRAPYGIE